MSFRRYLKSRYTKACEIQRGIAQDLRMVRGLRDRSAQPEFVGAWMRSYGLFQGVNSSERAAAVAAFLKYSGALARHRRPLSPDAVRTHFHDLLVVMHQAVERSWMSATSKLLWCIHPHDIVIYDAFVHRSLVVLQCVEPGLDLFDRIGPPPKIDSAAEIDQAVEYYVNYQAMVRQLQARHQPLLDELRERHSEPYPYDVRIIDKILWMIGNPSKKY